LICRFIRIAFYPHCIAVPHSKELGRSSMANVFEQAREAAHRGDWLGVNQCIERMTTQDAQTASHATSSLGTAVPDQAESGSVSDIALNLAMQVLAEADFKARWDAAKLLRRFGTDAIAPLMQLAQDEAADPDARWFALRSLGGFDQPDVVLLLADVMQTAEDEDLQAIAAESLASLGVNAIASLASLLSHADTQLPAVKALSRIRCLETIEPLLIAAQSADGTVRSIAVEALSSFHNPRVTPVLLAGLRDISAAVRWEAVVGLGRRTDLLKDIDLVTHIQRCLWDVNLDVCRQAARSLGRLGTPAAVEALRNVLLSPHTPEPLRIEVARALGWTEQPTALAALAAGLALEEEAVHGEIVRALGQMRSQAVQVEAANILSQVITTSTFGNTVRQLAAHNLAQVNPQADIEPLLQLLTHEEQSVQLHAIAALKQLNPTAAYQQLQSLAHQPEANHLQSGAAIVLREWDH
jgi:HEAT repeat protein